LHACYDYILVFNWSNNSLNTFIVIFHRQLLKTLERRFIYGHFSLKTIVINSYTNTYLYLSGIMTSWIFSLQIFIACFFCFFSLILLSLYLFILENGISLTLTVTYSLKNHFNVLYLLTISLIRLNFMLRGQNTTWVYYSYLL